jgi:dTDP-4-dehydrorhamnose reductase
MPETCLVLGGSGFLGREAVPVLAKSFNVVATSMRTAAPGLRQADIREEAALRSLIADVRPDCVALLAAYRDPDFCEANPEETRRLNVNPARALVDCLPPSTRLLFVSTDYVFDGEHPPYSESTARNPLSVYGRTKMEAEDIVLSRAGSVVVRVPLLMGWTEDPKASGFISHLVADVMSDKPLMLDDVLIRYPVWTRDMGEAMRLLLEKKMDGVFHYSTTRPLTRYRAAVEMAALMGRPADHLQPSREIVQRKAVRPRDARLAIDKWLSRGFSAPHDFREVAGEFVKKQSIG